MIQINGDADRTAYGDSLLVPASGCATVAFDADNTGHRFRHCHTLFHMATGMMTELAYDGIAQPLGP